MSGIVRNNTGRGSGLVSRGGQILSYNSGNLQTTSYTSTSETYAASGFKAQITPTTTGSSFLVKIPFIHLIVTSNRWSYCQPHFSTDDSSYAAVVTQWFANPKTGDDSGGDITFQGMPSFIHTSPSYTSGLTCYWQVFVYSNTSGQNSQIQAMGNPGWKWWVLELGAA